MKRTRPALSGRSRTGRPLTGLLVSVTILAAAPAGGQEPSCLSPPTAAQPAYWGPVGAPGTTWALDVAFDPSDPARVMLAGAPNGPIPGGVFLSEDGGATWARTGGFPAGLHIFNVELSPDDPDVLYAMTDPATPVEWYTRSETHFNKSLVYRSIDRGSTWCLMATLGGSPLRLLVDERRPGSVWAATSTARVFRSDDLGATWLEGGAGLDQGKPVFDIVTGPTPDDLLAATPSGVFRSSDGGITWTSARVEGGLPGYVTIADLAQDGRDRNVVYAVTPEFGFNASVSDVYRVSAGSYALSTIYRTEDFGSTWERLDQPDAPNNADRPGGGKCVPPAFRSMAVTPSGALVASGPCGVWSSRDGGESWAFTADAPGTARIPRIETAPDGSVWATSIGQGVWVSRDDALTFERVAPGWPGGGTTQAEGSVDDGQVCRLAPLGEGDLIASCGRSGFRGHFAVARSADRGRTWEAVAGLREGFVRSFAPDPVDGNLVLAATETDGFFRSADRGRTWQRIGALPPSGIEVVAAPGAQGTFYAAATIGDTPAFNLYGEHAPAGLWRTRDGGLGWEIVGHPPVAPLQELEVSPTDPDVLYAGGWSTSGTPTGGLWRSEDGGRTWARVDGIPAEEPVNAVGFVAGHPEVVLASGDRLYRSTDGGRSFEPTDGPLNQFARPRMFATQPALPGVVYLAGDAGLLRSEDAGLTWAPLEEGLEAGSLAGSRAVYADRDDPVSFYALAGGPGLWTPFTSYGKFLFRGTERPALTVTVAGSGTGTVTSDPPGITCGQACTAPFALGTTVTLTASPAEGSSFLGWQGCDSTADDTCTVTMTTPRAVEAFFEA